jgi:hypothetical protein
MSGQDSSGWPFGVYWTGVPPKIFFLGGVLTWLCFASECFNEVVAVDKSP